MGTTCGRGAHRGKANRCRTNHNPTLTIILRELTCIFPGHWKPFTLNTYKRCNEEAWMCKTGAASAEPCDIYEKAMRVCANMIKSDPFLGYEVREDDVSETHIGFPWPWLVGCIVSFLCIVLGCCCCFRVLQSEEEKVSKRVFRGLGES